MVNHLNQSSRMIFLKHPRRQPRNQCSTTKTSKSNMLGLECSKISNIFHCPKAFQPGCFVGAKQPSNSDTRMASFWWKILACSASNAPDIKVFSTAWCWWLVNRPVSLKAGASCWGKLHDACLFSHDWVGTNLTTS